MGTEPLIKVETDNGVTTLILNRPEVHNALSAEMMIEFVKTCEQLSNDENTKVIILTGAGDRSFCSGADLGGMSEGAKSSVMDFKKHVTLYRNCLLAIRRLNKPIIAAVNGYALAGGLGLAATCDLIYASENAQFGVPEINVGLWGMMISKPLLTKLGYNTVFELMYLGNRFDTNKAKEIGLINNVFSEDTFYEQVNEIAEDLSKKNPVALQQGRESLYMIEDMGFDQALNYLRDQVMIMSQTEDYHEGMNAFKEKREPQWTGK